MPEKDVPRSTSRHITRLKFEVERVLRVVKVIAELIEDAFFGDYTMFRNIYMDILYSGPLLHFSGNPI